MIVPIIEFSQESENMSLAKIIPSGDKKNASEHMYPQNVDFRKFTAIDKCIIINSE